MTDALKRAAKPPVAALAELLNAPAAPADDRARAARVLGALDDARAAEALLAAVGRGPPAQRDAVVRALAGAPKLDAAALFAAIERGGRRQPAAAICCASFRRSSSARPRPRPRRSAC